MVSEKKLQKYKKHQSKRCPGITGTFLKNPGQKRDQQINITINGTIPGKPGRLVTLDIH